jgi:methionyl-tRNA formyltransferase
MLPEVVWNMPPLGTINLHGSRLPNYRGAAPIQWAIMNGEVNTGCTVFQLTHDIDTGDILSSNEIAIGPNETAGELYLRMMHEGAALLVQTLNELELGQITPIKQQIYLNASTKHAPKLEKEHGKINFNNSPEKIHNQVRGVTPFPGAFTLVQNKILKIFKGKPLLDTHTHVLGSFITDNKSYLRIAVQGGYYDLNELQLEGKKRMGVEEFLRGNGNLFS